MTNPVLVEVMRGATVESVHRGAACVIDATGKLLRSWGDVDALICPRSALKPLQAIPLLRSGAAVTDEELALACASHSGEQMHIDRVAAWLSRMGLSARDLECGAHAPGFEPAARAMIRAGEQPSALHNNCSGKHTGFLCCAKHMGVPTRDYVAPNHPVQQAVLKVTSDLADWDVPTAPFVIDGCSAPNFFLPLRKLALAWARLDRFARIVDVMKAHPLLMSGTGRPCARIISALKGRGIVKTGAEGVFGACLPERGLGIVVKIDDGAGRAAVTAIANILKTLDAFESEGVIADLLEAPLTNWRGTRTGVIRASRELA